MSALVLWWANVNFRAMVGCQLLCYGGLMSFMLWWANVSFRGIVGKCQLSCYGGTTTHTPVKSSFSASVNSSIPLQKTILVMDMNLKKKIYKKN